MIESIGCYWCKNRKSLKCLSYDNVDLPSILRYTHMHITEESLRERTRDGHIGCECTGFKRGLVKEKVVFT